MHIADDWEELLVAEVERQQRPGKEVVCLADVAFALRGIYEALEARGVKCARYHRLLPGEGHSTYRSVGSLVRWIEALPLPAW